MFRLLPLLILLSACATSHRPVRLASSPSGAHIYIDGRDTGFVTPITLDLPDKAQSELELVLPGYKTARRTLNLFEGREVVPYSDSTVFYLTWRLPFFLAADAFWGPIQRYTVEQPGRVYVRLDRS
jgi:hypothetical protein